MEVQDPTRVRLLEAAGEEFAEKGFEAARIRTICVRAGANVAAVNYHFGDKEQLYVQVVLDAHRCGCEAQDQGLCEAGNPSEQLRDFIHHFLCRVLAINEPDGWRHRILMREMLHPTSASDVVIREMIRPRFERLTGILRGFCPAADDKKLNALAFNVIGQCLHYKMARAINERLIGVEAFRALDLDYLTDHITSFCLAALGCRPPLNERGEAVSDGTATAPSSRGGHNGVDRSEDAGR
jgi:TetR/AcrR family transcriptional regulator, regulator of cefoperazone and chloramphenicol sensitivity